MSGDTPCVYTRTNSQFLLNSDFDELIGDALYDKLQNPFAEGASAASTSSKWVALAASNLSYSPPPASLKSFTTYLAELPGLDHLPRDSIVRQSLSLCLITYVSVLLMYFGVAGFSYYFIFDHRMKLHPRFQKDQVRREIQHSLDAIGPLTLMTVPWFLGDVRGYSKMYDTMAEGPFGAEGGWKAWAYMAFSIALFFWFTDITIYYIHRAVHLPILYKKLHKPHHRWVIPTPFASHAFHPVDGYFQSIPYHAAAYLWPIHKTTWIASFIAVNLWTVFIHDSDMISGHFLEHYINGPAHHTLHHLYFTCNYGQYFTLMDKAGGSFRIPSKGDDPLDLVLATIAEKEKEKGGKLSKVEVMEVAEAHMGPLRRRLSGESSSSTEIMASDSSGEEEEVSLATKKLL
ncbi:hypothetical protein BCR35DRAFT_286190 [Leucosporidium creatinivorum]|uniref:Fatty acid hydroxylase domain-containing protein n=1 Tax=Leucosporidium creatinivorum TaxID=106004 RepID=A0A1Y2G4G8_9BASI|nr:hypothetical protein BCR35DRAFT_286190 [Leucosporidium creatinivorum]